jgi:hypothetical protein
MVIPGLKGILKVSIPVALFCGEYLEILAWIRFCSIFASLVEYQQSLLTGA